MSVRKQVYDLTLEDLHRSPIWEFTDGKEDEVDWQDEATVRPVGASVPLDSLEVMCIAASRFTLADGSKMHGFLSLGGPGENNLGNLQPTIITAQGHVAFWFGIIHPTQGVIEGAYSALRKRPVEVFPITFSLTVPTKTPLNGSIPGFLSLDCADFETVRLSY